MNISGHPREVEKVTWGVQTIHASVRDSREHLIKNGHASENDWREWFRTFTSGKTVIHQNYWHEYFRITRQEKLQRSDVQLSERLGCLGIMGVILRATLLKLLEHHSTIILRGLRGSSIGPPIMPSDASISNSRCIFFSLVRGDAIWNDPFVEIIHAC